MSSRLNHIANAGRAAICLWLLWAAPSAWSAQSDYAYQGPTNAWSNIQFLKWGPFDAHPGLGGGMLYDDNIYLSTTTSRQSDLIWIFSPSLLLGLGDYLGGRENYLTFRYEPNVVIFTDQSQNNSLDHYLDLYGQWRLSKLVLGLRQGYQVTSGANVDAGTRLTQTIYPTRLNANYEVSPKTSLALSLQQTVNVNDQYFSYNEWINENWFNYQITGKINLGAGPTFGYRDIQDNPNQTFERLQVRANYAATGKTTVSASVGLEMDQYEGGQNEGPLLIFNLGASYQPFDATALSLQAYRNAQNSIAFAGQNYTTTGFGLTVQQRFYQKYFVTLSGGYDNLSYRSVDASGGPDHDDNYFYIRTGVNWAMTRKWSIGAYYQYRQKDSDLTGQNFDNNQMGVQTRYTF